MSIMSLGMWLFNVVAVLLVAGLFLWAINALPWIPVEFKQLLRVVVIVVMGLLLIGMIFGAIPPVYRVPLR